MSPRQTAPAALPLPTYYKLDLVAGCQLRCPYCGIRGTGWPLEYLQPMPWGVLQAFVRNPLPPRARLDLGVRGEPLLHPHLLDAIALLRAHHPTAHLMLPTNGVALTADLARDLFRCGLNTLLIELYLPDTEARVRSFRLPVPHRRFGDGFLPWLWHRGQQVCLMPPLEETEAAKQPNRRISNHGGYGRAPAYPPLTTPKRARCQMPFRELTLLSDGTVSLCCHDWLGRAPIGHVTEAPLLQIWNALPFQQARYLLLHRRRDLLQPCAPCDYKPLRAGLLPHVPRPDFAVHPNWIRPDNLQDEGEEGFAHA